MLLRYQDKEVQITTVDGAVFTGIAEVLPSGYGLHEFDREEESIQLDDVILFKSDIRTIEELSKTAPETADPRRFDDMMGELLEGPYWIVDILPEQVGADAAGQYFAVERYFLRPGRIVPLRRKYAGLRLLHDVGDESRPGDLRGAPGRAFRKRVPPGCVRRAERDD